MPTLYDFMSALLRFIFNYVTWGGGFVHEYRCPQRSEAGVGSKFPSTEITGSCELCNVGSGNQALPTRLEKQYTLVSHLSSYLLDFQCLGSFSS